MRIGVVLEDDKGMDSRVSAHFGPSKYSLIVEVSQDNQILETKVVANTAEHGGGGCAAVDEILKHDVTHVIAGGMGAGAQQKFAMNHVKIFGYQGNVRQGIEELLKNSLGGIDACTDHGSHEGGCHH